MWPACISLVWDQALKAWRGAIFQSGDNFILSMTLVGRQRNFQSKQDYLRYEVNITPSGTNTSEVCFDNDPSASDPTERKKVKVYDDLQFVCSSVVREYEFNLRANRFLVFYLLGYFDGRDNNENTPSVSGGMCTKVEQ